MLMVYAYNTITPPPLMAQNKATQLSPKHWKALELIEEGLLSMKDIAKLVGWSKWTLYELMSGNVQKTGTLGQLFYSELKKMHSRNVSKVKHLAKDNQRLALIKLNERLRLLKAKKPTEPITKEICKIMQAIGRIVPNVEINQSYSFTKGMTPEELVHEFTRLKSVAASTLDGKGVPGSKQGGSGAIPALDVGRSRLPKE